jgi:DNA ligase-1
VNATTAEQQAVKEARSKWRKMVKVKYNENIEMAGVTERIKPMLAETFAEHEHKLKYPVTVQPKLNGHRCLAYRKNGEVFLQSRKGDQIRLPHVINDLQNVLTGSGPVLDGELYIHGMSLQNIGALIRRPRPESLALVYCVFDVLFTSGDTGSWLDRLTWLESFFQTYSHHYPLGRALWKVPGIDAHSKQEVIDIKKMFMNEGYEGAIVRAHEGEYRMGHRSAELLKLKDWKDGEYPIVGFTVGRGKFENAPIFTCRTPEGKDFEVTPMGTAPERYQLLLEAPGLIGKLLTVKYAELTEEGKPSHARGVAIRDESDLS